MAGSDEPLILEVVPRMALEGGSGAVERVKGKELAWNLFVSEVKNTSGDLLEDAKKKAATVKVLRKQARQKQKTTKAPMKTGKAVAAIRKIQTEKMDKTTEGPVETGKEAVAIDKYRLPADYVRSILAMPRGTPFEDIPYLQGDNLAKLMGVTEEWLEEERRLYKAEAVRMQRISDDFVQFQDKVRADFDSLGYFEVDEEYLTNVAKLQEYSNELCKDQDWSGMEFADRNDPDYASWYEHCEPEPAEELCSVK